MRNAARSRSGGDAREQVGREADEALLETGGARVRPSGLGGEAVEDRGDVLERLALEQAGEQQVALLPERELLVEIDVVATREQAACLQLDERRGDQQELGRDVEVERSASAVMRSSSVRYASTIVLSDTS